MAALAGEIILKSIGAILVTQLTSQLLQTISETENEDRLNELLDERENEHRERMVHLSQEWENELLELKEALRESNAKVQECQQILQLDEEKRAQIEEWRSEGSKIQAKLDEKIEEVRKETLDKLKEIQEGFEKNYKSAEAAHREKMSFKDANNEKKLAEAEKALEEARKKGEELIDAKIREIESLAQKRKDRAQTQKEEREKLLERFEKELEEVQEKNSKLTMALAKDERKHRKQIFNLAIQHQSGNFTTLANSITQNQSTQLVAKYNEALNSGNSITYSIRQLGAFCATAKLDASAIKPGSLDPLVAEITKERDGFKYKVQEFRRFSNTLNAVPREMSVGLMTQFQQMEKVMNNYDLEENLEVLALAYDKGKVKKMGRALGKLKEMARELDEIGEQILLPTRESMIAQQKDEEDP